jgi:hypothetical protein
VASKKLLRAPEEEILEKAKTAAGIGRSKEKLSQFGMNPAYFDSFDSEIVTASGYMSDEEYTKKQESTTNEKNAKLAEAGKWGDGIKLRLELAYPDNAEIAKEFPSAKFTKAKRDEKTMLEIIPNICNLIDKHAAKLKEKGMPDDYKQQGQTLAASIDKLNNDQETMKKNRPQYTQERVTAYQKLYDRVNEINKVGRTAYADSAADLEVFRSPWKVSGKKEAKKPEEQTTK